MATQQTEKFYAAAPPHLSCGCLSVAKTGHFIFDGQKIIPIKNKELEHVVTDDVITVLVCPKCNKIIDGKASYAFIKKLTANEYLVPEYFMDRDNKGPDSTGSQAPIRDGSPSSE